MIVNKSGITIRMAAADLRVMGRATQGVRLINLKGNDEIASVCRVPKAEEEDIPELAEGIEVLEGEVNESNVEASNDSTESTEGDETNAEE